MQEVLQNRKSFAKQRSRARLAQIHDKPFPLEVYQLPAFLPHNPISILRLIYAFLSSIVLPTSSHPTALPVAYFCDETRTIHVTDSSTTQKLWNSGFFGKGNLSRSESTWIQREKQRLGLSDTDASEEVTRRRREERREFKRDRARREQENIEEKANADLDHAYEHVEHVKSSYSEPRLRTTKISEAQIEPGVHKNGVVVREQILSKASSLTNSVRNHNVNAMSSVLHNRVPSFDNSRMENELIETQEHLQLTLQEGFFLVYGLGALSVRHPSLNYPLSIEKLLLHCCCRPADMKNSLQALKPDDPFLINYVVYHHFRSLGWVVRSGIKFSVDFLLYNRGPPFAHAEFAVNVIRDYQHSYWTQLNLHGREITHQTAKSWFWLHCINRVQSQVLKSLVFVYVYIPPPVQEARPVSNVAELLERYKVKEFIWRRWIPNRNRD